MAGSLNKVTLIGNLGADPEVRRLNSGDPVVNLSIATSDVWKDKHTGERQERTEWHRVVIFNERICEVAEKYLKKGSKIYLEGKLQTRKWTDQSGVDKYTTEVVLQRFNGELLMLDTAGGGNRPPPAQGQDDYGRVRSGDPASERSEAYGRGGGADDGRKAIEDRTREAQQSRGMADEMDDEIPF